MTTASAQRPEHDTERVVHARGATAFGFFEAYGTVGGEPISRHTRAKLFQEKGKRTDVIKFPDFIHSQKPDPVTLERQDPNRAFDFLSQTPEALHMLILVFSPRASRRATEPSRVSA